jgi:diguanylate cyclase (GGDEF)-like protein
VSVVLGGGFLATAVALLFVGADAMGAAPALAALLIACHALASRVEFDIGPGSAVPTQLVLVPMLFALPPAFVPLAVAAGYLAGGVVDALTGRIHPARAFVLLTYCWHSVGPALVLMLFASPEPAWADWPVYALALAAQFAFDFASSAIRERLAFGLPVRELLPFLVWAYAIDALLAPVGLLAAFAAAGAGGASFLLAAPLVGLLALLARDRRARIERAIAFDEAYRGAAAEARTDALTGLGNRLAWEEALAAVDVDRRALPISLIVVDLDGLKAANDTRGHECGDDLLRAVARVARETTRDGDLVARIGGDELGVLMPGADEEACAHAAARLAETLGRHPPVQGLRLSAAIGRATCEPGASVADARRVADARMYAEKHRRRRVAGPTLPALETAGSSL